MTRHRPLAALLGAACLAALPAAAESQSSNSSSNCSNGRCTRSDSLVIQDDGGRARSWSRVEAWREGRPDRRIQRQPRGGDAWRDGGRARQAQRDDDDDDDD
jgi:hypothetical protein